jgi:hypothetical protein
LSAIFGAIAVLTNQTHWEREPAECEPIATPLTRMLNRLPAKQLTKLYELIDPAFLAGGIVEVAGPSIRIEVERFNERRFSGRVQGKASAITAGNPREPDSNGGNPSSISRSNESIPTANAPFIGKPLGS